MEDITRQRSTHRPTQPSTHQRHLLIEDITRQRSTHQRHLLMEDITRQRSTHRPTQPSTHQRPSTHQPSTHLLLLLLMEDITSHFANASTPSMGNPMHTGETRTPSVGPRDQVSATSTATLTVATSSLLPVHPGASLPWPVTSSRAQNGSKRAWKNNFRFFQFGKISWHYQI